MLPQGASPGTITSVKQVVLLCLNLSRAILSDTRVRRQWMFLSTLLVLAFVFAGYFFGFNLLKAHPALFAAYLVISLGGLVFLILFALFDLLLVRRDYHEARRAARRELTRHVEAARHEPPTAPPPS